MENLLPKPSFFNPPLDATVAFLRISKGARYSEDFALSANYEADSQTLLFFSFQDGNQTGSCFTGDADSSEIEAQKLRFSATEDEN